MNWKITENFQPPTTQIQNNIILKRAAELLDIYADAVKDSQTHEFTWDSPEAKFEYEEMKYIVKKINEMVR